MSYIGQTLPADTFQGFTTDSFAGDGSATTFTLSKTPFNESALLVVINNVVQKPTTNFTVSGTTLTIVGTAVASGDVIYATHIGGALPIGQAASLDLNGASDQLILDADADTTISADTDDQIDFKAGGTDIMSLTATTAQINDGLTVTVSDNTDNLTLISTDTDASYGPNIEMSRPVTGTTNDLLGRIDFSGQDAAGNTHNFFSIEAIIDDATSGAEYGRMLMRTEVNGATKNMFDMNGSEFVFNEDSVDYDFRVEGNTDTHLIFVDAGNDRVQFNRSTADEAGATICSTSDEDTHATGTFDNTNSSFDVNSQHNLGIVTHTTANEARMIRVVSGNGSSTSFSDNEFIVRNDGSTLQDGSASTSGADYAEFFEWKDGNSSDEDRVGFSVILDGDQIVKATDSDDASKIIGVVSGNPTILGDAAPLRWKQKYLRDDFNRHLQEEYTVTEWKEVDENGKKIKNHSYHTDRIPSDVTAPSDATVKNTYGDGTKMTRRKSNPDYDSSKEYIPREKRKEWETIGLMGKLRILKGQPTGTNWIKMRDISDTVEEWLVR
jgi:hypothetical protein